MINATKFGPGTFTLGTTEDFTCQVQSMTLEPSKDEGDAITTLCGDSIPGSVNYTYALTGTVVQDLAIASGLVEFTWTNAGVAVPFEFTPNTAAVASVSGTVIVDPLSIGGEEFGGVMTSDFEWQCVGKPVPAWHTGAATSAEAVKTVDVNPWYPEPTKTKEPEPANA